MRFASTVIAVTAVAGVAMAQTSDLMIATPETLTQCQPYLIKITGGQPPFFIAVTKAGDPSSIIEPLPQTSNRQVTWPVNVPSGQKITLTITDSTGNSNASSESNSINPGSDDCLNKSASFSGSGNTANPTGNSGSNGGSSTPPSSNSQNSGTTPTSDNTNTGSPTPNSESQGGNGAAQLSGYSAAVAGVVGIVVAALF